MNHNIMLVDDNVCVLESLKWIFKDEPYELFAFNNPEEALRAAGTTNFAVVLADQSMPDMHGTVLLREVKSRSPNTVGLIMSAFVEVKFSVEAINSGLVYQFIRKPWDERELRQEVAMAIAHYENESEKSGQMVRG